MKTTRTTFKILFLTSTLLIFVGCNPNLNSDRIEKKLVNQKQNIDELPEVFENPDIDSDANPDVVVPNAENPNTEAPAVDLKPSTAPATTSPSDTKVENKPQVSKPATAPEIKPAVVSASRFIFFAHEVLLKEGKSIGTPCNYYVQRVLVRAGFPKGDFRANDFDVYAKKNFKFYKAEDFKIDSTRSDKDELKKHLWSYPERTPFILQWTRPGHYGHIAILERIGENLVIYQASIGSHTAQRSQTKIENLLSSRQRAFLTVYAEFK